MLGLCLTSLGDIGDGVAAYQRATQLAPNAKESWTNMALALKEASRVKEAEAAFLKALGLDKGGSSGCVGGECVGGLACLGSRAGGGGGGGGGGCRACGGSLGAQRCSAACLALGAGCRAAPPGLPARRPAAR
jgi:tetratricopeptide (TPR) repeat protein